jgi:hypothetical protein
MQRDKVLHFAFGLASALAAIAVVEIRDRFGLPAACLALAAAVGVGYEVVQKLRGSGEPSVRDALATAAGGAMLSLALLAYSALR